MADTTLTGHRGALFVREWPVADPRYIAFIAHGYGEHLGRYTDLAAHLNADGATVVALDHAGHGQSEGERVLLTDIDDVVSDLRLMTEAAARRHPGLKQVLIGHSMGGLIGARYLQRYGTELTCAVLSGPLLNAEGLIDVLLSLDALPTDPLDPGALSRDPAVGAAYAADPLVWHGPFKRPTLEGMKKSLVRLAEGPTFPCPVLMLHGAEDPLLNVDLNSAMFDRVRGEVWDRKVYPGARHEVFNETNRAEVFADVTGWIDRFIPRT